jgi:hypothetical protein
MLECLRISGWKPLVTVLYAVAMLTLGFAHSRSSLPDTSAIEALSLQAAAYALPDGSVPPICGQSKSDGPAQHHGVVHCDACQLTAAPGAIPPPPMLADAPRLAMKLPPVRVLASIAETAALEPQSRGPPLLS